MENKDEAKKIVDLLGTCGNEAEVRFKIIDRILCDILNWPRSIIKLERTYESGRIDYLLEYQNGDPFLIVEAKSCDFDFSLPVGKKAFSHYIKISALNDTSIVFKAMQQARSYANEIGAAFCCVTNGHQWYFFQTSVFRKKWVEQRAFYISNPMYFVDSYIDALKYFSYEKATCENSLSLVCGTDIQTNRPTTIPADSIRYMKQPVEQNDLAKYTKIICSDIFGEISENNHTLMENCYVTEDNTGAQFNAAQKEINDSLAPFFLAYKISDINNKKNTGKFEQQVTDIVKDRLGKTIVVFGGKGAGKTTFLRKILTHKTPNGIKYFSHRAIVTLTDISETKNDIQRFIYDELISKLDSDKLLVSSRDNVLKSLFPDEFKRAQSFELLGLKEASLEYINALNDVYKTLVSNKRLTVISLVKYWAKRRKGVIIVIDNTDQFKAENQDYCFAIANEISKEASCLSIITMREERFYNSKLRGYLDAYGISSYHLKSPFPNEVFKRRLDYLIDTLLPLDSTRELYDLDKVMVEKLKTFFSIIRSEFTSRSSTLSDFITSCSHGDVRLALDFFKDFLVSGYLNVREMIDEGQWKLQTHQVIKPMMVPQNYFYSEELSGVMNIYRVRDPFNGSHFTTYRILENLSSAKDAYIPIVVLDNIFNGQMQMRKDFELNIDEMLKRGMIEADIRVDGYNEEIKSVKITHYGLYVLNSLSCEFTYFDLIVADTPMFDSSVANAISRYSNQEIQLFWEKNRNGRMSSRIEKVKTFVEYLKREELRESQLYGTKESSIAVKLEETLLVQYERIQHGLANAEKRQQEKNSKSIS